jgi:hypothetical protein
MRTGLFVVTTSFLVSCLTTCPRASGQTGTITAVDGGRVLPGVAGIELPIRWAVRIAIGTGNAATLP